ncbi:MAG TPA: hypothetical protein VM325_01270 [Alphaproteobacteria bacterium]|nr:hypothetical protein [Alphaproteobacteria bacterium]
MPITQLKTALPKTATLALAAVCIAAGSAWAAEPSDAYLRIVDAKVAYAAEIVMSNGKVSIEGRIAHRPGVTRTHLGRTVVIHDHKRKQLLQFVPGQKHYLQLPALGQARAVYLPPGLKRAELRAETLGSETVAGEKTQKIKLRFPTGVLTVWQTTDGIVVKMEGSATVHKRKQTVTMALKNLKRGPQDPALFLSPPGSTPLNAALSKTAPKKK